MAEKYFPFNSQNGDREYLAEDFARYFESIITSGVVADGSQLPVTSAGGLKVAVGVGMAWIKGRLYENTATLNFTLANGAANPRIDRVVVRLDVAARKITARVIQGTAAASPVAPALVRNADYWDIGLAEITVPASAVSITNSAIKDTRTDDALCGVTRCLVDKIPVDEFMKNCQASFDEWFSLVQATLGDNAAGQLLNLINGIREDLDNGVYSTTAILNLYTVPGAQVTMTIPDDLLGTVTLTATADANGYAKLYPNKLGNWTAKAVAGGKTYTETITVQNIGIFSAAIPSKLENMPWNMISGIGKAGAGPEVLERGATKNITLTTGEVVTLRLEDFNHDDLATGSGKAPFSFMMLNLMAATAKMNTTDTNVGGWNSSAMRTSMSTFLAQLPADLRAVIRPVKKKTTAGNKATTIQTTTDSLWLASAKELNLLTTSAGYQDEGETYPLFVDNESRIKKLSNGAGSANGWWTRSPSTGVTTYFRYVASDGSSNHYNASVSYGVCLGLCV